jgi:hypothetical protein
MGVPKKRHHALRRVLLKCYITFQSRRRACCKCSLFLCLVVLPLLLFSSSFSRDLSTFGIQPWVCMGCGASKYGFIRAANCHPYALPQTKSHLHPKPKVCGKLSGMMAGYCLCDDNDATTTIAAPKSCGTKPVRCEKECAKNPIVGTKPEQCITKPRPECKDTGVYKNILKPSKAMLDLARAFSKSRGADLGVALPAGSRRDVMKDFVMYDRRMAAADVEVVKRRVDKFKREVGLYKVNSS